MGTIDDRSIDVWVQTPTRTPWNTHTPQRCNLAAAWPDLVLQLLDRLEAYNRTSVPARYPPPDPRCDPARSNNVFVAWAES